MADSRKFFDGHKTFADWAAANIDPTSNTSQETLKPLDKSTQLSELKKRPLRAYNDFSLLR